MILATIADLEMTVGSATDIHATVLGYHTPGDGGGGEFFWDATENTAGNGGTIFNPTTSGPGRWKRLFSGSANVKWFGAVGNDISDDTDAFQMAFNYLSPASGVFVPAGKYQILGNLTIPEGPVSKHLSSVTGDGMFETTIRLGKADGIGIAAQNIVIAHIGFLGAYAEIGSPPKPTSYIFKDVRPDNTADFDLFINDCLFDRVRKVVYARGRGVNIEHSMFAPKVIECIIDADFPNPFDPGPEAAIQSLTTGFRGMIFKNNRVHHSTCFIVENIGYNAENLIGVLISNNQLEGGPRYFKGYAKNLTIEGNTHYQNKEEGDSGSASIELTGGSNIYIDVNITGMDVTGYGYDAYSSYFLTSTGKVTNLTIKGGLSHYTRHLIYLDNGGDMIDIDINASQICASGSLINFQSGTYTGVKISGLVTSPHANWQVLNMPAAQLKAMDTSGLIINGAYGALYSLNQSTDNRNPRYVGVYAGTGNALTQNISTKYPPNDVTVYSNDASAAYYAMQNRLTTTLGNDIVLSAATGFNVTGNANVLNKIYVYVIY